MIIKAVEALARALCEVSPSGTCDGMEIHLPEENWRAVEREMQTARYFAPLGDHPAPEAGPVMLRLYTQGGDVLVKRKAP
jgi:hypothetical protein